MAQEENRNIYILSNYVLEGMTEVQEIVKEFPSLTVARIAPGIHTVEVPPGEEGELKRLGETVRFLTRPVLYGLNASAALNSTNILQFHEYPYGELRGKGVLIGFVDTGIDYTNEIFKNANNTTRILSIWDQTIEGDPPASYSYGTEYSELEINLALKSDEIGRAHV